MPEKLDYKKEFKDLYMPKQKPMLIQVPSMHFIMVDGKGAPSSEQYQTSLQILYALSFTIKMSKMSGQQPVGYFEYVVPPLEGLWWCQGSRFDWNTKRSEWLWTSMIRQPEFVTKEVYEWAVEECKRKKPELNVAKARFEFFDEGLCVQMMHIGSYDDEFHSIALIDEYISDNGLINITGDVYKHHEIYLSDPRKIASNKLKTILRFPVKNKD